MARTALLALLWTAWGTVALGQGIYSYTGADGSKVFTNIGGRDVANARLVRPDPNRPAGKAKVSKLPGSDKYDAIIDDVARRHGEDRELVKAIIAVESAFDPQAVSKKNCKGLMQLHPETARQFGVRDVFDPSQNIEGGVQYLKFLRENFDDLELILAAYNAGEGAVRKYDGIPPYEETENYVEKVLALYTPPERQSPRQRRKTIYRVELPDGRILLTNTPSQHVASQADGERTMGGAVQVDLTGTR